MESNNKLLIMGYMGSGKSYYGKKLAEIVSLKFVDLDHYIESKENLSISQIFERKGEVYFRKKETHYLSELLDSTANSIIALGGGTPCYGVNLEQIKSDNKNNVTVYLQKSVLDISKTLYNEKSTRPLISHFSNEEDFIEYISKHLFERQYYYLQADHKINLSQTDNDQEVLEELKNIWDISLNV